MSPEPGGVGHGVFSKEIEAKKALEQQQEAVRRIASFLYMIERGMVDQPYVLSVVGLLRDPVAEGGKRHPPINLLVKAKIEIDGEMEPYALGGPYGSIDLYPVREEKDNDGEISIVADFGGGGTGMTYTVNQQEELGIGDCFPVTEAGLIHPTSDFARIYRFVDDWPEETGLSIEEIRDGLFRAYGIGERHHSSSG